MYRYKEKQLTEFAGSLGSMLLFLLFAVCSLIIICIAADTCRKISDGFDNTFNTSAALRYISNKIHSSDNCVIADEGKTIILYSDTLITVIYSDKNGIYEAAYSSDYAYPSAENGDKIFADVSAEAAECEEGLIKITVVSDNNSSSLLCGTNGGSNAERNK